MVPPQAESHYVIDAMGTRVELPQKGTVTLGSAPAEEGLLHFEAEDLEHRHCVIGRTKSGAWAVKDLGGQSGTYLNGKRVTKEHIQPGDQLRLGALSLRFEGAQPVKSPKQTKRLGGFKLERALGRGAMGEVVLAVQESLDRRVALKLLKTSLAQDADFVQRFQVEAKHAAALSHPHVVHVYDVGVADGRHYLAMEYMAGGSLESQLQEHGPLPVADVQRALVETASALAYAEERGIVHRDIKPENLMLDAAGRVKLADLGLAVPSAKATSAGAMKVLGTPHFMAPEQARGAPADHRSDLYSLGATAFRLLTGRTPFQGESTREILRALFTQPSPSARQWVHNLPPTLDAILLKLMEKEPEDRFASASELLSTLNMRTRATKPKRTVLLPLTGAALLLAAGGVFFLRQEPAPQAAATESAPPTASLPTLPKPSLPAPVESAEQIFQSFEAQAQDAYRNLGPIAHGQPRLLALEKFIQDFPGSTTASQAQTEAEALRLGLSAQADSAAVQAKQAEKQFATITERTKSAPRWADGAARNPCALIVQLLSLGLPNDPKLLTAFKAKRAQTIRLTLEQAGIHTRASLDQAQAHSTAGDFASFIATLEEIIQTFDQDSIGFLKGYGQDWGLHTASEEQQALLMQLGLEEFLEMLAEAKALLAERDTRAAAYQATQAQADRKSLAAALYPAVEGAPGLLDDLQRFAFLAAKERLVVLAPNLNHEPAQMAIAELIQESAQAQAALDLLIGAHADQTWRRGSVPQPHSGYGTVTAIDRSGLTLELPNGPHHFPWSAYHKRKNLAGLPTFIERLFKNRLARDYTHEEVLGIASLTRFAAIENTRAQANLVLLPGSRKSFNAEAAQAMQDAFDVAEHWGALGGELSGPSLVVTQRERAAATLLAAALLAHTDQKFAVAAATLETLLADHSTSLVVLLLSDGRGIQ